MFKIKVCSLFDPANPLCYRRVLSIYTIYVSGKLGQGRGEGLGRGRGRVRYSVSRRRRMVRLQYGRKKSTQMTFKMGSMSLNHSQLFALQDYYKYRNNFNIIRCENNSNQRQQ